MTPLALPGRYNRLGRARRPARSKSRTELAPVMPSEGRARPKVKPAANHYPPVQDYAVTEKENFGNE